MECTFGSDARAEAGTPISRPLPLLECLFQQPDPGVVNPEPCETIKVTLSILQEPPAQSLRFQGRACDLRCPNGQRPDRSWRPCYAGSTITFVLTGVREYRCIMS